jgi:hypothetical protein
VADSLGAAPTSGPVKFELALHFPSVLNLEATCPLRQGVQACRKALRIRHINGMEVCKDRPKGFKKRHMGFK